jgi:DNA (cytosine-5)-methyltransferase 1
MKFISLFSGGGLADVGAKAAGFELAAANEIDPAIAETYQVNHGDHIRVGDVLEQDPQDYPDCDLFHASPVCTNASIANANGEESVLDIATAEKTAEFIRAKKPKCFTLENVSGYRYFTAYRRVMDALDDCGYFYDVSILNAADFGVPQTRRRLFVRAVRNGFVPALPQPVKWVGWYEAIQDIVHTFPETTFANWQLARLPQEAKDFIFNENRNSMAWIQEADVIGRERPYATVVSNKHLPKAFIVGQQKFNDVLNIATDERPAHTVTSQHNQLGLRAFIVSDGAGNAPRRAIVNGTPNDYGKSVTYKDESEPMFTVTASEPRRPARAWLEDGRVVKITPRGLARFQSVPDWYILPKPDTLAAKIIGNGVPCLLYQRIAESMAGIIRLQA